MDTRSWLKAIRSGGFFVCELAMKILEISPIKRHNRSNVTEINEMLFYGAENQEHKEQIGLNNLLCIYDIILRATRSVDVCVPSLVSDTLAKSLINVSQKNKVKIRITIHSSDNYKNLVLFAQNGIEVKVINPAIRLEHEFLLIDACDDVKDALAVMGSIDYETTRVNCNRDATLLTSDKTVITTLKREFERVWNSVSDIASMKGDKNI